MNLYRTLDELSNQELLLLPMYKNSSLPAAFSGLPEAALLQGLPFDAGKEYLIPRAGGGAVLAFGLGDEETITAAGLQEAVGRAVRSQDAPLCIFTDSAAGSRFSAEAAAAELAIGAVRAQYRFTKINAEEKPQPKLSFLSRHELQSVLEDALTVGACVSHARTLGNTPSNYMTPEQLAAEAKSLALELGLKYEILTNAELERLGAGAILGVNRGSSHGARLITLWYEGDGDAPYTALVGKGLTFDAGGYNLKTAAGMRGMKFDMCGAANVLCAFELAVRRKAKVNLMAVIGATENKIGPDGYNCDDVLVSLSGKTIEITNTDAEGRLVLSDAITYAQQKGARRLIDMATLTGACVTALGSTYTGAFTNSPAFLGELKEAADRASEKLWQLPVDSDFHKQVRESDVADMTNAIPGAGGGSSLAAAFLEEFVEEGVEWIHLDIAGTSDLSSAKPYAAKGATGVMVRTLGELFR